MKGLVLSFNHGYLWTQKHALQWILFYFIIFFPILITGGIVGSCSDHSFETILCWLPHAEQESFITSTHYRFQEQWYGNCLLGSYFSMWQCSRFKFCLTPKEIKAVYFICALVLAIRTIIVLLSLDILPSDPLKWSVCVQVLSRPGIVHCSKRFSVDWAGSIELKRFRFYLSEASRSRLRKQDGFSSS